LAKIITEIIITEQRIMEEPTLGPTADTTQLYAAILQKYGYNSQDFLRSVAHHARKPDKFKRELQQQRDLLAVQKKALEQFLELEITEQESDADPVFFWSDFLRIVPDSCLQRLDFFFAYPLDSNWIAPSLVPFLRPWTADSLPAFRLYEPPAPDTLQNPL